MENKRYIFRVARSFVKGNFVRGAYGKVGKNDIDLIVLRILN